MRSSKPSAWRPTARAGPSWRRPWSASCRTRWPPR
jgi:hypothetical protein